MIDLTGRNALVTGASRGIGRAIALALAACGANVAVHHKDDQQAAELVARAIKAEDRKACTLECDLTVDCAGQVAAQMAAARLGSPIDILVVNAAIQEPQHLAGINAVTARRQFDANFLSALALLQEVLPGMKDRAFGRIVHVGSVQQWKPHPDMAVYAGLKAGLANVMQNLAVQVAANGITVNTVSPGAIETDRNRDALNDVSYRAQVESRIPAGRIGVADECAGIVAFLCSDAAAYLTGANIPVDGGMRLA